jgi:uncharacterized protein (DUF433 family)
MAEKPHPYVERSALTGNAYIVGTRVPVRRLWSWHKKGVLVETLVKRYPSLGWVKVLDALSWCYDNQEIIDKELDDERALLLKDDELGSHAMEQLKLPEGKE